MEDHQVTELRERMEVLLRRVHKVEVLLAEVADAAESLLSLIAKAKEGEDGHTSNRPELERPGHARLP